MKTHFPNSKRSPRVQKEHLLMLSCKNQLNCIFCTWCQIITHN